MSTPDELRAAAVLLDRMAEINAEQHPDETLAREQLDIGATSARRLADVLDLADDVTEHWRGLNDTHSESCWRWHAGCLARVLRDMEDQ